MLLIVTGLPGTGKTTFAEAFAKENDFVHLNSDLIRETLGLQGDYRQETKELIYKKMQERTTHELKTGKTVVVDATFYRRDLRRQFEDLAKAEKLSFHWIQVQADEALIRERVSKKRDHSEANFAVYQKIKSQYEPLEQHHIVLWSTNNNLDEMVKTAKYYLLGPK